MAPLALTSDIRDIKPPLFFPQDFLFLIVIGGIIVLAAIIFLVMFLRKRLKRQAEKPIPPPRPADQIALEALVALKAKNLPGLGKSKEYYFELSDIARRYIEDRFSLKAPEMTTEEFLSSLRIQAAFSGAHKNLLKEFLTLCDIVKFAKYGPSPKEIDESFNAAVKLVEET